MTPRSRAAWFRGAATVLVTACSWDSLSGAADVPAPYGNDYRAGQRWNDQRSFSTDTIAFSLMGFPCHAPPRNADCCKPMQLPDYPGEGREIQYPVPRNFIVWMEPWNGGSQTLVRFKATYPGFAPLTKSTEPCLTLAPAYRPSGCVPIGFSIRSGGTYDPPDEVAFHNRQDLFHSQKPLPAPFGFQLYETGPADARVNTYRKQTSLHTLVIDCFLHAPADAHAVCQSTSRLDTGNVLSYFIDHDQLRDAEEIDSGIRRLVHDWLK